MDETMTEAKIARNHSTHFPGDLPRLANLSPHQFGISGLAIIASLAVLVMLAGQPAPSQTETQLRHAAPSPAGTWTCVLSGEVVGKLTVDDWRYELVMDTGEPQGGTLAPVGGQAWKNKAGYVRVASGPLKDDLGLGLGIHDNQAKPETLSFNSGPGSGIGCVRS
jgi:hypothetical protein